VLGLRPTTREEEGGVVFGWLQREERRGLCPGQLWYLIASDWWLMWQDYVNAAPPFSTKTCQTFIRW
jgi:ubiquitin carboxyl-terminal hydrolase 6/32